MYLLMLVWKKDIEYVYKLVLAKYLLANIVISEYLK